MQNSVSVSHERNALQLITPNMKRYTERFLACFLTVVLPAFLHADEIEEAIRFSNRTANLVYRDQVNPRWMPDGKSFWYRVQTAKNTFEYVLIDASTGARQSASTLQKLGLKLQDSLRTTETKLEFKKSSRAGQESLLKFLNELDEAVDLFWIDPQGDQIGYGSIEPGSKHEQHTYAGHVWLIAKRNGDHLAVVSARDLLLKIIIDGKGIKSPTVKSRKSKRHGESPNGLYFISTERGNRTNRQVTIVESSPQNRLQPRTKTFDYIKPGDPLPKPQLVISHDDGTTIRVPRDHYENPFNTSGQIRVTWAPDSSEFYFDYNQRGHQLYQILAVNPTNGDVRVVVHEESKTFIDYTEKTWRHWLHDSDELIWMSERDGWCHLYLCDVSKGQVKNQITQGNWPVRKVLQVDELNREIWFLASGLRSEEDPYHLHLCRVDFEGQNFVQLTNGDGNHKIEFSPDREFFIDSWSRADHPQTIELRRSRDGSQLCQLEKVDISSLLKSGWTMPERFVAKGRDGSTDIHGVLIKPSNFDPKKKYPVVEDIYAGPHSSFAPKDFSRLVRMHEIAELGFIVVKLDGMGTDHRGKAFHDICWKNLKDSGFPDRKLWIMAAAKTRPWMDLSRVGIYGGSAGGQSAMRALLDHHDFYHVAVADCGCHDNRMDKIWWNEQWMGWPVDNSYKESSNLEDAHKLKGQLLLIVGELDTNVDPASTSQVVGALQKAGKTFDFMPIIGTGHGAAETPYGSRLRMQFLLRHLHP